MRHPAPSVILVVEDEPLVRMTPADKLGEVGFQVLEAMNADEALKVMEARSDEVQVLFTDVNMPGSMDTWRRPNRSPSVGRTYCC